MLCRTFGALIKKVKYGPCGGKIFAALANLQLLTDTHRRTGHPGFWFFGGNLALCRYYSRMLALQIKAMEEGIMKHEDP